MITREHPLTSLSLSKLYDELTRVMLLTVFDSGAKAYAVKIVQEIERKEAFERANAISRRL